MDALDRELIALLRTDGRAAVANLAAGLGVSRATVKARLDRLGADGVIQGFTVVLNDPGAAGVQAITRHLDRRLPGGVERPAGA
ncbi:MAG TPA: AsnC family transcriptional regulator [Thermohalobaculum sp.]|nr:AsnC family transcriptional regulator [Thermohalobaculum sp.]